jgi:hypothetical protein
VEKERDLMEGNEISFHIVRAVERMRDDGEGEWIVAAASL